MVLEFALFTCAAAKVRARDRSQGDDWLDPYNSIFSSVDNQTRVMSKVISAKDLVPNLYDDDEVEDEADDGQSDSSGIDRASSLHEDIVDDLTYDVRNLTACNYHPIFFDENGHEESKEQVFIDIATRSTQLLLRRSAHPP